MLAFSYAMMLFRSSICCARPGTSPFSSLSCSAINLAYSEIASRPFYSNIPRKYTMFSSVMAAAPIINYIKFITEFLYDFRVDVYGLEYLLKVGFNEIDGLN